MAKLANRAKMTISSTGTGNITLASAVAGYQSFLDAGVSDNDVIRYIIEDNNGADWEIGTAAVSNNSTVLVRTVEESSAANNAALSLTSSAKVFIGVTARDLDNASPIFTTTPPASLILDNDGSTAVTLNAKAYDESGIPVQYSWDAWASGGTTIYDASSLPPQFASAPSINQSTGVYSFVGSSNSSNEGVLNFRVKVSDGVKIATHVAQLNLEFGFDIENATYANKSYAFGSNTSQITGMFMHSNGSRCWVTGKSSDAVFQYDLSTNYDISTASYNSVTQSVSSSSGTQPSSVCFSSNGSKMYVSDKASERATQHDLTTNWDISAFDTSAAGHGHRLSFATEFSDCEGIAVSTDDTKIYALSQNGTVYQYNMTTAGELSTATYANKSKAVGETTTPMGVTFNTSGTKMFINCMGTDKVFQYNLSEAWNVSTAVYSSKSFDVSGQSTQPVDLRFSSDGNHMYVSQFSNDTVYQYDVS